MVHVMKNKIWDHPELFWDSKMKYFHFYFCLVFSFLFTYFWLLFIKCFNNFFPHNLFAKIQNKEIVLNKTKCYPIPQKVCDARATLILIWSLKSLLLEFFYLQYFYYSFPFWLYSMLYCWLPITGSKIISIYSCIQLIFHIT